MNFQGRVATMLDHPPVGGGKGEPRRARKGRARTYMNWTKPYRQPVGTWNRWRRRPRSRSSLTRKNCCCLAPLIAVYVTHTHWCVRCAGASTSPPSLNGRHNMILCSDRQGACAPHKCCALRGRPPPWRLPLSRPQTPIRKYPNIFQWLIQRQCHALS